eukprot:COSAG04_NODE_323_length_16882_cov_5.975627_2_plen_68_part_00
MRMFYCGPAVAKVNNENSNQNIHFSPSCFGMGALSLEARIHVVSSRIQYTYVRIYTQVPVPDESIEF